jgi:hypothetical protein
MIVIDIEIFHSSGNIYVKGDKGYREGRDQLRKLPVLTESANEILLWIPVEDHQSFDCRQYEADLRVMY